MKTILNTVEKTLKKDSRLWSDDEKPVLLKAKLIELLTKDDEELLSLLINEPKIEKQFFKKVGKATIFQKDRFIQLVTMNEFLPSSFTAFENKIGLAKNGKLLSQNDDISLVFPHKDCILEGGQTKEEQKRDEIFYNTILAPDEVDRLKEPKVFTNAKRISANEKGEIIEEEITEISETDNMIIKGNNLMALYSLLPRYRGKIKLIYIDPPYNPTSHNNTFTYNNNFNHSSWLTFMKNRLEVGKQLLTDDGAYIIAIDENEVSYLGVLIDEFFQNYENHCVTIVHNPRGIQGTNFSYTHEYAYFIFPKGKKIIGNRKIEKENIKFRGLRDNGGESLRTDAKTCFYPILVDKCTNQVIDFGDVCNDKFHPPVNIEKGDFIEIYPVDKEGIERKWRYSRNSVEKVKDLLKVVKNKQGVYDIQIGKDFGMYRTVWIDKRYDANEYGTKIVNSLVKNNTFSFPKSLWNVYDCIYAVVGNDKNAIVLDYHAGSGTTAHAVLELNKKDEGNRKFIMVEQMDYVENVTAERIKKVMQDNKGGNFVYTELLEWNQKYIDLLEKAKTHKEVNKIKKQIEEEQFYKYQINLDEFDEDEFSQLSLEDKKKVLLDVLDLNHLYVNIHSMDDATFKVSEKDKELNRNFYNLEK